MVHTILKKISNNKWLTTCLLLGMIFLVAVTSSQPMFQSGSENKLLTNLFHDYIVQNNQYPTVIQYKSIDHEKEEYPNVDCTMNRIDELQNNWVASMKDVPIMESQSIIRMPDLSARSTYASHSEDMTISYMVNMDKHIQILKGEGLDVKREDAYPCIISQAVMEQFNLVVGEKINFQNCKDQNGKALDLVVTGFFKEADDYDPFWFRQASDLRGELFVSKDTLNAIESEYENYKINFEHSVIFDYKKIDNTNALDIYHFICHNAKKDNHFQFTGQKVLSDFLQQKKTINVVIWALEIPIIGLIFAFLIMVSRQVVEMEKSDISMLRSRGYRKLHIIYMYIIQFSLMALLSLGIGLILGYGLCMLVSNCINFLTFSFQNTSTYQFTPWMILYGTFASLVCMIIVLIPVFFKSNLSIVEQKSGSEYGKKPFWEKCYLDIILLVISLYLLYAYYQAKDRIQAQAISGTKIDPGIFLDSTLLILAFGLISLRLSQYLIRLIYHVGKKKWKPAVYASLLQITRNFNKQGFISVFMILTISLGLFNANIARNIYQNSLDRIEYSDGADLVMQEHWNMRLFVVGKDYFNSRIEFAYEVPDDTKYTSLVGSECKEMTKVIYNDKTIVESESKTRTVPDCILLGINTKEFGEVAELNDKLNKEEHWFTYLNRLALEKKGVIISRNLAKTLNVKEGDTLYYKRMFPVKKRKDEVFGETSGNVVAIVDAWPGFEQYYYEDGVLKERNLIVANYGQVVNIFEISPYQIWMKLSDDITGGSIIQNLKNQGTKIDSYKSIDKGIYEMRMSPLLQITYGMFTLSFLVALILCTLGFLIYWISSIKQRELLFGVYRAMGMSMKEINKMLFLEHIFTTFLSIITGIIVGTGSSLLFVKLLGVVYLPQKSNLDFYIYFEVLDVVKLAAAIAVVLTFCLITLRKLIKNMNITQALKLGEE